MGDPLFLRADAGRLPLPDQSVDLVIGSPPYLDARLYLEDGVDLGIARKCKEWVRWMIQVTHESLRVSRGLVLWVCSGKTEDWCYQPGPEGLLWEWWQRGGECHCFRPCYWHRYGIPGSGGEQWFRADVEYVLAFKRPGRLPYADPKSVGYSPLFGPGGEMSHRTANGTRINAKFDGGTQRRVSGVRRRADRPCHQRYETEGLIVNPGTLLQTGAGGSRVGPDFVLDGNEAPYPEAVPAFFIRSHTPSGGLVLDPFSGSGTTAAAALALGRRAIGCDLRQSQCRLGRRRIAEQLLDADRPHRPTPPRIRPGGNGPGPGRATLFDLVAAEDDRCP